MSQPLAPDLEQKAQQLAARIRSRSETAILDMARQLVAATDDTLFGDTEFALRDHALGLVADAYTEHLDKKVAISDPPSIAPTAADRPSSRGTGKNDRVPRRVGPLPSRVLLLRGLRKRFFPLGQPSWAQ